MACSSTFVAHIARGICKRCAGAVFVKSGRSVAAGVRLDRAMLVLNVFLLQRLYV